MARSPTGRSGASPSIPADAPSPAELRAHHLRFSSDVEPGIRRRRAGRGFSYRRDVDGSPVGAAERARIAALAVPPAWTDVWICGDDRGHVQASGRDDRGRKQYRYHDEWRALRDARKFADLAAFGAALPELRRTLDADLSRPGFDHAKMVALVLALMDATLIRVGNDRYAKENGTFGLTTLTRRHVVLGAQGVRFRFVGKGGIRHEVDVDDRRLARLVRRCHELGGRELFSFVDSTGAVVRVDSSDANDYLRGRTGAPHTVKTFRTWGATAVVVDHLAAAIAADAPGRDGPGDAPAIDTELLAAIDAAARRLGNTRAIARASYVHPEVATWVRDGSLRDAWRRSRTSPLMDRAERTLLRLLDGSAAGPIP